MLNKELQERALQIAMRHPGVRSGDIESCLDDLWLRLYDELGWAEASKIDADALLAQVKEAVEIDRLRSEGWSAAELRGREMLMLVEESRPAPGEDFDWRRSAGPLADLIAGYLDGPLAHRYLQPVPGSAGPEEIEAKLAALGAPSTCTVGYLDMPPVGLPFRGRLPDGRRLPDSFEVGSMLPLGTALEIADETGWEAVLLCVPRRLAYVQHHEVESATDQSRAIACWPTEASGS